MSGIYQTALNILNNQNKEEYKNMKFDCSSFVQYCYGKNGKQIPRTSGEQWSQGQKGNGSEGDIACWNGHVGICDGNGNVIHSYRSDQKIYKDSITNVSKWDKKNLKGYKRF